MKNEIMILCKVVDNYGDIGVVYRLARSLSDLNPSLKLTLVVSNLESFKSLENKINPSKEIQTFKYKESEWKILKWDLPSFSEKIPPVILECFQCGRPEWLENILFSQNFKETIHILNIDYLTAEDYAEDFHLLKSGTRKINIKKRFFMPGFTSKTGGLILSQIKKDCDFSFINHDLYNIFFFAYEDECSKIVDAITDFQKKMQKNNTNFKVNVFLAAGKSSSPFMKALSEKNFPFLAQELPFLPQETFDAFILEMDFLFVRGEDSLARACLSHLPFVWQAYKQDENYQLVKVQALLDTMRTFFTKEEFKSLEEFWLSYNDYEKETKPKALTDFLIESACKKNTKSFQAFSDSLYKNGNLAENLLQFIEKLDF